MNELTELGELNTALARRFGAHGALVHTMASDLFPVIRVDGEKDPDLSFLFGERLLGAYNEVAAPGAGLNGLIALLNPLASGIIVTLETADVWVAGGAGQVLWAVVPETDPDFATLAAALAFPAFGVNRDSRWTFPSSGAAILGVASTAGFTLGANVGRSSFPAAATAVRFPTAVVLNPGSAFYALNGASNASMNGSFQWKERRRTAWERQP